MTHTAERIEENLISITKTIASSYGLSGSKLLVVEFSNGGYNFTLTKRNEVVYSGTSSQKAVDMYNDKKGSRQHFVEHFQASELLFSNTLYSSSGRKGTKSLDLVISNCQFHYEVKKNNNVLYSGSNSMKAVDTYNEI